MPAIRDITSIAQKWTRVTPERSTDYEQGVQNPKRDWKTSTLAAKETYKSAMQKSLTDDRYAKGVGKVTSDKWKDRAVNKGARRFGEGVALATADYSTGFGPFRDVIERTTLPPRFPKGDPRNIDRVRVLAEALHKAKIG